MNTNEESEDIVKMREEIVKQCLAGKPLFGKDGALAPMIQSILNAVLEGEMDAHLTEERTPIGQPQEWKDGETGPNSLWRSIRIHAKRPKRQL